MGRFLWCLIGFWLAGAAVASAAGRFYVSPGGVAGNDGTVEAPWDIASALEGRHDILPGGTIFLRAGVYRRRAAEAKDANGWNELFEVKLVGEEGRPIQVKPYPGEHVVIDGGLRVVEPSGHVWIWDLEILVSEPNAAAPVEAGSHPASFKRPWGGLHVMGGKHCKFIHLAIHDCRQGVSWWSGNHDSELYGALIYDNGWPGTDRGHGHAIYTQNQFETGTKYIRDCIMTGGFSYTMHAYGSARAYVDRFHVEGNIAYDGGTFLIGGGRPSRGIVAQDNYLYKVPLQLGYNAPHNEDCVVRGNIVGRSGLQINKYQKVEREHNLVVERGAKELPPNRSILRPSAYDSNRAHLAIYNWQGLERVEIEAGDFLKDGESYRLFNPKNLYGKPVFEGVCRNGRIHAPTPNEFAAYVVIKSVSREQ